MECRHIILWMTPTYILFSGIFAGVSMRANITFAGRAATTSTLPGISSVTSRWSTRAKDLTPARIVESSSQEKRGFVSMQTGGVGPQVWSLQFHLCLLHILFRPKLNEYLPWDSLDPTNTSFRQARPLLSSRLVHCIGRQVVKNEFHSLTPICFTYLIWKNVSFSLNNPLPQQSNWLSQQK